MNIELLNWDPILLHTFKIPLEVLPEIKSSSEIYGKVSKGYSLENTPISGVSSYFVFSYYTIRIVSFLDSRKSTSFLGRAKMSQRGTSEKYL